MKKILALLLIITLVSMITQLKNGIPLLKAQPPIHQGDLIISGTDVYTIKSEVFIINGSIRVTENATLELKDAVVNFTQRIDNDHGILFSAGNTKFEADNVTIISKYDTFMNLQTNCSANIDDLHSSVNVSMELFRANLTLSNSVVGDYLCTSSYVIISNSEIMDLESYGDHISISYSDMGRCELVDSLVMMHNTTTKDIHAFGSKTIISVSANLIINGSILIEENATLTLENAFLEFTQEDSHQLNMTFINPAYGGNPRLIVDNVTITTSYGKMYVNLFYNSSASINKLMAPRIDLYLQPADVSISNSTLAVVYVRWDSIVNIEDSSLSILTVFEDSSVDITNCSLVNLWNTGSSTSNVTDSIIEEIETRSQSTVRLLNSTFAGAEALNQSNIYVSWYLDVHVIDSIAQNVPSAEVDVYYPNATLAISELTDVDGWIRLILMQKMMNATGDYPVGNYTVEATYDIYLDQDTVNMTQNKELVLELDDFIIPEFPSITVLSWVIIITLLGVAMVHRKKKIIQ